jgi:hypothetical protein
MKKDFRYDRIKNEWIHNSLPLSIDNDLFNEMTDDEIVSLINSKLVEVNNEINSLPKPKKKQNFLNDEELASGFAKAREMISLPESFKQFFTRKDRLSR